MKRKAKKRGPLTPLQLLRRELVQGQKVGRPALETDFGESTAANAEDCLFQRGSTVYLSQREARILTEKQANLSAENAFMRLKIRRLERQAKVAHMLAVVRANMIRDLRKRVKGRR